MAVIPRNRAEELDFIVFAPGLGAAQHPMDHGPDYHVVHQRQAGGTHKHNFIGGDPHQLSKEAFGIQSAIHAPVIADVKSVGCFHIR